MAYESDGSTEDQGGDERGEKPVLDQDQQFCKLQKWFKSDYEKQGKWRTDAHEDFAFGSGDQLTEDDKAILKDANRPIVIFNRIEPVIDSVAGQEVGNRQMVQFIPRQQGAVQVNEVLTSAAKWFRDGCDAEDEESDAFRDMLVCGMGWTETKLDYEDNPAGEPKIDRIDPLEMVWDRAAKKRNLVDGRRVFHIVRDIPLSDARALCPGDDFEDSDYDATWVDDKKASEENGEPHENDNKFYNKEKTGDGDESDETVTMVRAQWWERVPAYMVLDPADPTGNNILTLSKEDFEALGAKYKLAGAPMPKHTKGTRKVYKQAYLGAILLEIGDAPCKNQFSFNAMTGKRDRNKNSFYGLVRAMKDPARWGNKWMSQTMHIMNTTSKGGIAAERGGFFDDDAEGEASWAKQDTVTYLKQGALSGANPKFIQKPVGVFPQSSFELMQFAVNSLPQVSGVNAEALGMQGAADQAASLDMQRKQSVVTILQPLFDSLRRYRKVQGRMMLYLIENFLSDGRLIKIVGPQGAQFVPLVKQEAQSGNSAYDVIVDESPSSPNQKEATWSMLQQLLPVIGKMLPPATWLALLKYSPLPTSAQKDISDSIEQSQQNQPPNPEAAKAAVELKASQDKSAADIANHQALTKAKIDAMHAESGAKRQIALEEAQHKAMTASLTAPPIVGPDGVAQPNHGADAAALVVSIVGEMRRDMAQLAAAFNTPKKLIRDPQTGELVGIAPMMGAQ